MIKLQFKRNTILLLLICYVICSLYFLYISPFCGRSISHRAIQPIPLFTIIDQFKISHGLDYFIGNMLGNILLLFPLGFLTFILNINLPFKRKIICFIILAFIIELMQFILSVGCMDIDDIWVNGIGGYWGYYVGQKVKI